MIPIININCAECKHFLGFRRGLVWPHCRAFPDGIPKEFSKDVWLSHTKPLPSQKNNIVFEKRKRNIKKLEK